MAPQASSFPFRHLTVALACAGLALALAGCASAPPQAAAAHQPQGQPGYSAQAAQATQPALAQYSLVHAAHLPRYAGWAMYEPVHGRNVQQRYLALERATLGE